MSFSLPTHCIYASNHIKPTQLWRVCGRLSELKICGYAKKEVLFTEAKTGVPEAHNFRSKWKNGWEVETLYLILGFRVLLRSISQNRQLHGSAALSLNFQFLKSDDSGDSTSLSWSVRTNVFFINITNLFVIFTLFSWLFFFYSLFFSLLNRV